MKDVIGMLAMAGSLVSGFAGLHFFGHAPLALVALLIVVAGLLGYASWRLLVPSDRPAKDVAPPDVAPPEEAQ